MNYNSLFPESLFIPTDPKKYRETCIKGYKIAQANDVVICGLARNLQHFDITKACIERIGSLFKNYYVVLYENDSDNDTCERLLEWEYRSYNVQIITEGLDKPQNEQDHSLQRRKDMAYYRNKYLPHIIPSQYTIVLDTDLFGYSYEGILHSLGSDLDAVGSNGLLYRQSDKGIERLYYDNWAYRDIDKEYSPENNGLFLQRGQDIIEVDSCFGGMAIYKTKCLQNVKYEDWDCDHVTLHKQIKQNGYKVWLNPSQITLYTQHYYQY